MLKAKHLQVKNRDFSKSHHPINSTSLTAPLAFTVCIPACYGTTDKGTGRLSHLEMGPNRRVVLFEVSINKKFMAF